jgi:FkbM family methyltransferase
MVYGNPHATHGSLPLFQPAHTQEARDAPYACATTAHPLGRTTCYSLRQLWHFCPDGYIGQRGNLSNELKLVPGALDVDVGAHDGYNTLYFARAGHSVITFEPTAAKAKRIAAAIRKSGLGDRITFLQAAASNHSGSSTLWVSGGGSAGSEQDTLAAVPRWSEQRAWKVEAQRVQILTLDEAVKGRYVFHLKVDAQGHEPAVLEGASGLLNSRRVDVMTVEISPRLASDGQAYAGALWGLHRAGYRCAMCDCPRPKHRPTTGCPGRGLLTPLSWNGPAPAAAWLEALSNMSFIYQGADIGWWADLVCTQSRPGYE